VQSSTDEPTTPSVCLTCGRTGDHAHHPAGRYNVPEITVPACTPGCHEVLTEKQLAAGIKLAHRLDRSKTEREWALLQGVDDVVGLLAANRGMTEVEAALKQGGPALGRTLSTVAPAEWASRTGAAGDVGPDPRRSDRRQAFRERRGTPLPTMAGDNQTPGSVDEGERAESLVGLLAETEQYLFGEENLARIDVPALRMRLNQLAERGTLERVMEWGARIAPDVAAAFAAWSEADGAVAAGGVLGSTAWLGRLADDAVSVLAGIAAATGVDRAEGLVDAFMEAWPPAHPTEA
jgi:hypothetical protein